MKFINAKGKVGRWFAKTGTTFHRMNSYAIMRPNLQNSFGFLRFKNRLLAKPFATTTDQAHRQQSIKLSIILSGVMCSSYLNRMFWCGGTFLSAPSTTLFRGVVIHLFIVIVRIRNMDKIKPCCAKRSFEYPFIILLNRSSETTYGYFIKWNLYYNFIEQVVQLNKLLHSS